MDLSRKIKQRLIRPVALFMCACFVLNTITPSLAQALTLPAPGVMVPVSAAASPAILKGIMADPKDPFKFEFILDPGDLKPQDGDLKPESTRLIKYFLAALATPEDDIWVNLSPVEKDRIVPDAFGRTAMGRDLLAQDYLLKQITASLLHPESETGKAFWQKIYKAAYTKFGTIDIPIDTFNKVWITPGTARIYTQSGKAYILESRMKVMLEADYLTEKQNSSQTTEMTRQILREIVIPILEKDVNEGANFAQLRQIYHSLILAAWFKRKLKENTLHTSFANQNRNAGLGFEGLNEQEIYQKYLEAYQEGVFNFIREETDPTGETMPHQYFSGGFTASTQTLDAAMIFESSTATTIPANRGEQLLDVQFTALQGTPIATNDQTSDDRPDRAQATPLAYARYAVDWNTPDQLIRQLSQIFARLKKTPFSDKDKGQIRKLHHLLLYGAEKAKELKAERLIRLRNEDGIMTRYLYPEICGPLTEAMEQKAQHTKSNPLDIRRIKRTGIIPPQNTAGTTFFDPGSMPEGRLPEEGFHYYLQATIAGVEIIIDPTANQFILPYGSDNYPDIGALIIPVEDLDQTMWPYTSGTTQTLDRTQKKAVIPSEAKDHQTSAMPRPDETRHDATPAITLKPEDIPPAQIAQKADAIWNALTELDLNDPDAPAIWLYLRNKIQIQGYTLSPENENDIDHLDRIVIPAVLNKSGLAPETREFFNSVILSNLTIQSMSEDARESRYTRIKTRPNAENDSVKIYTTLLSFVTEITRYAGERKIHVMSFDYGLWLPFSIIPSTVSRELRRSYADKIREIKQHYQTRLESTDHAMKPLKETVIQSFDWIAPTEGPESRQAKEEIERISERVLQIAKGLQFQDSELGNLEGLVFEILANMAKRAYPHKGTLTISRISLRDKRRGIKLTGTDDGPGMDIGSVANKRTFDLNRGYGMRTLRANSDEAIIESNDELWEKDWLNEFAHVGPSPVVSGTRVTAYVFLRDARGKYIQDNSQPEVPTAVLDLEKEQLGGIDFDPRKIDLVEEKDPAGTSRQNTTSISTLPLENISGLIPVILNIRPAGDIHVLLTTAR
jgi:anti-sigma regulatory factor (Ser/Thr protein kinase)